MSAFVAIMALAVMASRGRNHARMASMGRCASMGQVNEVGASICRMPNGKIVLGPKATGTPMSVKVPIQCPPSATFEGIIHTHPGGVPIPSQQDLKAGRQVGANVLCIKVPETGVLRCYRRTK